MPSDVSASGLTDLTPRLTALAERCPDFYRECKGEREWLAEILTWYAEWIHQQTPEYACNSVHTLYAILISDTPLEAALSAAEAVSGVQQQEPR